MVTPVTAVTGDKSLEDEELVYAGEYLNVTGTPKSGYTKNLKARRLICRVCNFFYDDGLPYRPPPPHTLDESPCKPIIRIDKDDFYYCVLHPDVRNIYLETIEHQSNTKMPNFTNQRF